MWDFFMFRLSWSFVVLSYHVTALLSALYPLGSQYLPFCLVVLTFWVHILQWFLCNITDPLIFFLAFAHIDLTWIHTLNSERVGLAYERTHLLFLFPILVYSLHIIAMISLSIHFPKIIISFFFELIKFYCMPEHPLFIDKLLILFHFLLILKKSAIAGISLEDYWLLGIWSRVV